MDNRLGWQWNPFNFNDGKINTKDKGLHYVLCQVLGSNNVYYQPPESIKMEYPAIVYSRENIENEHADNMAYMQSNAYQLTVIDEDPDSEIVYKVSMLPTCRFSRHFVSDNLNHDVFLIYF